MMTRRVLLGTGAVVVGAAGLVTAAELTHRLDDVARAVGLDPKPEPDPADDRLLRAAATDMAALVALVEAIAAKHPGLELSPLVAVGREQLDALGGSTAATDIAGPAGDAATARTALVEAYRTAASARAAQALRATSPELVQVLASMSAGLAQCGRAAERSR
ncbi:MAG: hypothetical protein ABWX57_11445 [Aeromicrobium sp.]